MLLTLQNLPQMLASAGAAAQAACSQLLDLSVGSPARAILRASTGLWSVQQANVYRLLKASRLATSEGADVDSFVADYGLVRDPATFSTGPVDLSRFSPLSPTTVVVGATVRAGDGSLVYDVLADVTHPLWTSTVGASGGYVVPVGIESLRVTVRAQVAGVAGDAIAGAISLTGDDMPGIDVVSNPAAITGGHDGETDLALKVRFVGYIASLSKATVAAVIAAITSVQAGLTCTVVENQDEAGAWRPGHFCVVVDDGSGTPPATLLTAVYQAVDLVRPIGSTFSVRPPAVTYVGVSLTITVAGGVKAVLLAPVQEAVAAYLDALPTGGTLSVSRVSNVAYAVSPAIINVSHVRLLPPGGGSLVDDLELPAAAVVKAGVVTVS